MKCCALVLCLAMISSLISSGCRPRPDASSETVPARDSADNTTVDSSSAGIRAARDLLQAGKVDDAAARLAQLQTQAAEFDAAQARDFRQAYSEAYTRAIEAIERGDPRGEAALRLLRVAGPR